MNHAAREALDRTLLLMRDELVDDVDDNILMGALSSTTVALALGFDGAVSHSGQAALITAANLIARCGMSVLIAAPNVPLVGAQPVLERRLLVDGLLEFGADLIPGVTIDTLDPRAQIEISAQFGSARLDVRATSKFFVNADDWTGRISVDGRFGSWGGLDWPFGALVAAALVAAEAFKAAMRKLRKYARSPANFDQIFAPTSVAELAVAHPDTPKVASFAGIDFISGGAIINAAIYVLANISGAQLIGRIIEPQTSDLSNLNRYPLLRRSRVGLGKAADLAAVKMARRALTPLVERFASETTRHIGRLSNIVAVGVDDIPARWAVQHECTGWVAVGATSHWSAMSSFHHPDLPCVGCLHPRDDVTVANLPTVSFVSFWAGLMVAALVAQHLALADNPSAQQVYFTPLRPESLPWRSPVVPNRLCPVRCKSSTGLN